MAKSKLMATHWHWLTQKRMHLQKRTLIQKPKPMHWATSWRWVTVIH
jgi:hypothetical protein